MLVLLNARPIIALLQSSACANHYKTRKLTEARTPAQYYDRVLLPLCRQPSHQPKITMWSASARN